MIRFLISLFLTTAVSASTSYRPVMVADIATTPIPASSTPKIIAAGDTLLYFSARTAISGEQLWVTDGTPNGTRRLEIVPGRSQGNFEGGTLGDTLIFSAGGVAKPLWVTDGTKEGTRLLHDEAINATEFLRHDGKLYFTARKATTGYLLWVTDGTPEGTRHLPTGYVGWTGRMRVLEGTLYVQAGYDPQLGVQLYRLDGTRVERIGPANAAHDYTFLNGRFVGSNQSYLFRRDSNDTAHTILHNRAAMGFFLTGSTMYFTSAHETLGEELWKTDGTPEGTVLIADVAPGPESSSPTPVGELHGRLLFVTKKGELWSTDGTAEGTYLVRHVHRPYTLHRYARAVKLGDHFYLAAVDSNGRGMLWRTDGTPSGTDVVAAMGAAPVAAFRGKVYFAGVSEPTGVELFRTSAGAAEVELLTDIAGATISSSPRDLTAAHGHVYFLASAAAVDSLPALWRSDGTDRGTWMLMRAQEYPIEIFGECGSFLYFTRSSELFSVDAAGQIRPLNVVASSRERSACAGQTFLTASIHGLYATDGTAAGKVSDLSIGQMVSIGSRAIFVTYRHDAVGVTDGTFAGTRTIAAFSSAGRVNSLSLVGADSQAYFVVNERLWGTDGTESGTRELAPVEPGRLTSRTLGSQLIFRLGWELWRSDGTPEGTMRVPGSPRVLTTLTATSEAVFAVEDHSSWRVWRTDGTAAGTYATNATNIPTARLFALGDDLFSHDGGTLTMLGRRTGTITLPDASPLVTFVRVGNVLFVNANDRLYGEELWMVDLTPRRRAARH